MTAVTVQPSVAFKNTTWRRIHTIYWLVASRSSATTVMRYLGGLVKKAFRGNARGTSSQVASTLDTMGTFTARWFDVWAPEFLRIFEKEKLSDKQLEILEIGSFEGRSTCFFLNQLPNANITAVDPWEPYIEIKGGEDGRIEVAERLFDENVSSFGTRITKFKGTSLEFFANTPPEQRYDVIYVDGSHFADDVLIDAVCCYRLLKDGGIMLFDDFIYFAYERVKHNTTFAINLFLQLKSEEIELMGVPGQLYLKKKFTLPALRRR